METAGLPASGNRSGGQAKLAKTAGVTTTIVSRALNASSVPDIDAILALADALGRDPVEGLKAAGHDRLVELFEKRPAAPAATEPEPAIARIEHAPGLSDTQRAWLVGFYRRRIDAARKDATREVAEWIEMLERRAESQDL